jgi:hypothetical protein
VFRIHSAHKQSNNKERPMPNKKHTTATPYVTGVYSQKISQDDILNLRITLELAQDVRDLFNDPHMFSKE